MIILLFDYSSTFDGCIAKVLHLDPDDLLFRVGVAHLTLLGVVYLSDQLGIAESPMVVELVFIAAIPVVVFSISLLFTLAATKLSGGTSAALSRYAGHVTWKQVRARAYGTDTAGEWAGEASGRPSWVDAGFLPVPEALSQELSRFSDEEAAKSISEFRIAMGQLRLFEDEQGNVAPPEFNWDGLIHTAYFNVPRFRKLVAYAISTVEGFRATEAFKADPDYALVAKWFEEIQPQKELTSGDGKLSAPVLPWLGVFFCHH